MSMVVDSLSEKIEPKSTIRYGYGMMFDYYGKMLHGLNKYNMIIGLKLPTMEDFDLTLPEMVNFHHCEEYFPRANKWDDIHDSLAFKSKLIADHEDEHLRERSIESKTTLYPICQAAMESHKLMKNRILEVRQDIQELLERRIPYVLRRFSHLIYEEENPSTTTTKRPIITPSHKVQFRKRRFISQLIGLGIQGVSAFLAHRQQSRIETGLKHLIKHAAMQDREIKAIRKDMMSLAKATVKDLERIKVDIARNREMIHSMIEDIHYLAGELYDQKTITADLRNSVMFLNTYFNEVYVRLERYLDLLKELKGDLQKLLEALELAATNKLSHDLYPIERMEDVIEHVKQQLNQFYPKFELVTDNPIDYYQMPLVSAQHAIRYINNMIVVQIPLYIKLKSQKPLSMYKIKTVPVPFHVNPKLIEPTESNHTYTEVIDTAEIVALSEDTHINVNPNDLDQCIRLSTVYFCQRLMLIKHKSEHTCESAIYHNQSPEIIKDNCKIKYHVNLDPKPEILDSGEVLLLSNLPRPWITKCEKGVQIPDTLEAGPYVVVHKHELCECSIMAGNPVHKVERNIAHCTTNNTHIHLYHTVNMAVMSYQFKDKVKKLNLTANSLMKVPIELDPVEPVLQTVKSSEVAKSRKGKPLLLKDAMTAVDQVKYLTGEDYTMDMNKLYNWFTGDNSIFGFMFIACLVTIILIPILIFIAVKYLGLKVHFGKLNSTVGKLVTAASAVSSQIRKAEAKNLRERVETDLLETFVFVCEILSILLIFYLIYKLIVYIYKWMSFQNLGYVQTKETLYKFFLYDKTDIILQLTSSFGAHTIQINLGTFFGNPDDLIIRGEIPTIKPMELETGCILDIISFNWNSFNLILRELALVLPISKTITGIKRYYVRNIFKSKNGMYKIFAYNKNTYKATVIVDYTKLIVNQNSKPLKPSRLLLEQPLYEMLNEVNKSVPIYDEIVTNDDCNQQENGVPAECGRLVQHHTTTVEDHLGDDKPDGTMDTEGTQTQME